MPVLIRNHLVTPILYPRTIALIVCDGTRRGAIFCARPNKFAPDPTNLHQIQQICTRSDILRPIQSICIQSDILHPIQFICIQSDILHPIQPICIQSDILYPIRFVGGGIRAHYNGGIRAHYNGGMRAQNIAPLRVHQ